MRPSLDARELLRWNLPPGVCSKRRSCRITVENPSKIYYSGQVEPTRLNRSPCGGLRMLRIGGEAQAAASREINGGIKPVRCIVRCCRIHAGITSPFFCVTEE